MTHAYQLKVTLRGTRPPIWRRVVVPGDLTLQRLHRVLQDAMGWYDSHLHSFTIHGTDFGVPDPDGWGGPELESEKKYRLEDLVGKKARFSYTYDFGDNWVHGILVEKVTPGDVATPRCIAGARACPPEDCGGAGGIAELVEALADHGHERHAELARWVPPGWLPERFDLALADHLVAKHGVRRARIKKAACAHVGANSRENVELIDGDPDRGPRDQLVSKHLNRPGLRDASSGADLERQGRSLRSGGGDTNAQWPVPVRLGRQVQEVLPAEATAGTRATADRRAPRAADDRIARCHSCNAR